MCVPKAFQVRVNLLDLRVGDLRSRDHRHEADALPDDGDEVRQLYLVRHERRTLAAAGRRPVTRFAHSGVRRMAWIRRLREHRRRERGASGQRRRGNRRSSAH